MIYNYNNTPVQYSIRGDGPVWVLLHGFLESSRMWHQLGETLSKTKTVITIDLPGHGKSGVIAPVHTMELMADVVHAILDKEYLTSCTLLGHSMGGYVSLAFAERYPGMISGLILLNSTPAADTDEQKRNRQRAIAVIRKNPEIFIAMAVSNLFPEGTQGAYASEINQLKEEALTFPLEGIIAAIKGMAIRKDRTSVLKQFTGKKWMICGTRDPIVPPEVSETLAQNTRTPLIMVPGGHMILTENYLETVKIMHFID